MARHQSTLTFITESIPDFTVGVHKHFELEASGGVPPYRFEARPGTLPRGLRFNTRGKLSGAAKKEGNYTLFVELKDTAGSTLTQAFNVQVLPAPTQAS
jgi:hypothetical protein